MKKLKLTRNQNLAMQELKGVEHFYIPPENQGQIVTVSYGCSPSFIFERCLDRSDNSLSITAYRHPTNDVDFDPWNSIPKMGRRIGVIFDGKSSNEPFCNED